MTERLIVVLGAILAIALLAACAGSLPALIVPQESGTATPIPARVAVPPCDLAPLVRPTPPAEIPGYAQLDPATGLHVTGGYHVIDPVSWRLSVTGKVAGPVTLTLDELRCMPRIERDCTLVCPNLFTDQATWAGARLADVLELARPLPDASRVQLVSADGYRIFVNLDQALSGESFLAYEWEGEPLPVLHGFPVRAVFPSLPGGNWAKWLVAIEVQ